jgi:hypothetical protein
MLYVTNVAYKTAVSRLSQWKRGLVQIRDRTSGVVSVACAQSGLKVEHFESYQIGYICASSRAYFVSKRNATIGDAI